MSNSTPKSGYDSWVDESDIHAKNGSTNAVRLSNAASPNRKRGYLWMPFPDRIAGRTIPAAFLTGHAHGAVAAQTITFQQCDARWDGDKITWHNQPGVVGPTAGITIPALADGQSFTVELSNTIQPIADGARNNHGWRITTNATTVQKVEAFDGPGLSWTLSLDFSEAPEIPTDLRPNGTVVGVQKPVVSVDFTDYGDSTPAIAKIQVQVDLNGDGTADADSGQVATTTPNYDLSLLAFTAPSVGGSVRWRAKVWDEDGNPSDDFSAWAIYTYVPLPTITLDSPAGGLLYDPTTDILAHIVPAGGAVLDAFALWILDAVDPTLVRYESRKQPAGDDTDIAWSLPLRTDQNSNASGGGNSRIFVDDHDYVLRLRAFDDQDREATPGVPTYAELETTLHFDDDLALDAPSSYQVSQIDGTPFVKHTWTDVAAADAYILSRNGAQVQRLEAADVVAGVSAYSWVETDAPPYVDNVYELRRLTVGVGRSAPLRASVYIECPGVWLLRDNGDYVCLLGDPPDSASVKDRFSTYKPVGRADDVDILTAFEGLSDDGFDHWLEDHYPMPGGLTVAQSRDVLAAIKRHPFDPVRLVFAEFSKPVRIRNLSVTPHNDFAGRRTHKTTVRFGVTQVGEFDYQVG